MLNTRPGTLKQAEREAVCAMCQDDEGKVRSFLRQRVPRSSYYRVWTQYKRVLVERKKKAARAEGEEGLLEEIMRKLEVPMGLDVKNESEENINTIVQKKKSGAVRSGSDT